MTLWKSQVDLGTSLLLCSNTTRTTLLVYSKYLEYSMANGLGHGLKTAAFHGGLGSWECSSLGRYLALQDRSFVLFQGTGHVQGPLYHFGSQISLCLLFFNSLPILFVCSFIVIYYNKNLIFNQYIF